MIRELDGGLMRLMTQKLRLLSKLKCKTTDGRVVHYSVYHRGGNGVEIVGPNLETRDAKTEIAKVYGVEVI
jgi:hypothetical protein